MGPFNESGFKNFLSGVHGGHQILRNLITSINEKYRTKIRFLILTDEGKNREGHLFDMIHKYLPLLDYDIITVKGRKTLSIPTFSTLSCKMLRSRLCVFLSTYKKLTSIIPHILKNIDYDFMINSTGIAPLFVDNEVLYIQPGSMDLCTGAFASDVYRRLFWHALSDYAKKVRQLIRSKKLLLIANSKFTKYFFKNLYGIEKEDIYVIYPRSTLMDLLTKLQAKKHKDTTNLLIIAYTRFVRGKRFEDLIKAGRLLKRKLREGRYKIILAGYAQDKDYLRYLINSAQAIKQIISFRINLNNQEALNLLLKSDIYVHTSRCEPLGLSVLEAMGAGNAIVTHMSGGPWLDILEKGRWGLGYESVKDLVAALYKLIQNEEYLRKYQEYSYTRFRFFAKRKTFEEFIRLIESWYST